MNRRSWIRPRHALGACVVAGFVGLAPLSHAGPLGYGLVVERLGGTSGFGAGDPITVGSTNNAFLDEYSLSSNSRTQTLALPGTDPDGAGPQRQISSVAVESATVNYAEGFMSVSGDMRYIVTAGFALDAGTASPTASPNTFARTIARVDLQGNIDTSTTYSMSSRATLRSASSADGTSFYVQTDSSAQGLRYVTNFGQANTSSVSSDSTRVHAAAHRTTKVINGRLWGGSTSVSIGPGVGEFENPDNTLPVPPNTPATATGFTTTSGANIEGFTLVDLNPNVGYDGTTLDTAYVARADAVVAGNPNTGGGIQKWTFDGSSWSLQYTLVNGLSTDTTSKQNGGILDIAYVDDGSGTPLLYATTLGTITGISGAGLGNELVKISDTGAGATYSVVEDSPDNSYFRGLGVIPEPASMGSMFMGLLVLSGRRRKRR
jgi:hypothetical protein